jgi:predicted ATPase
MAARRALVCVCDDIQWAEPALLDLLRDLAARSNEAPILCCLARPELLELRPRWPGVIALRALSLVDADLLLARLVGEAALPAGVRDRVAEAAAGNPLFIEQLAAMFVDEGLLADGEALAVALPVPPTLQALLAARFERLEQDERHVLTRAAVAGQTFHRGALRALISAALLPRLDAIILALIRKEFVAPAHSEPGSGDAFQFRHLLIRDTAYEALTKEDRAELHERFGRWLEQALAERPEEVDVIVGYHLEQAHDLLTQLAPLDERGRSIRARPLHGGPDL